MKHYNEPVCTYIDADMYFYNDPQVLEDVGHLVGRNYETDDDQASDIIYESFVLAGMIYGKREEQRDNPVILSWKSMAEDEEVFNDQRMGWRKVEGFC